MSAFKANPHSGYQPEWRIDGSTMQSKTVKNKKKGAQKQQDRKSSQKKKKKKGGGGIIANLKRKWVVTTRLYASYRQQVRN